MNKIGLKNYRCFHERQSARLAPLTLLVGENSTGKTSFMAMIRALWDIVYRFRIPDFKEEPYDLGSFDEIAHHRGAKGGRANIFEAELEHDKRYRFEVTFKKKGTIPVPVRRRLADGDTTWIEERLEARAYRIRFGTRRGTWEKQVPKDIRDQFSFFDAEPMWPPFYLYVLGASDSQEERNTFTSLSDSPAFNKKDRAAILQLAHSRSMTIGGKRPFASAPVRSKPRRTYDPSRPTPDPEGDYVPMYLANMFFQDRTMWTTLKKRLESFGKAAGLFDEISIKPLGKKESEPFQVQIRKFGGRLKGPQRNLIDVGYGVSQVLPMITELLRPDAPALFLLQQPEVHLHPSAQAALGSLFCQVANKDRQLVIETHSDHLMDRVRMDVRDRKTELKPDDVSILFFERKDLDVHIHSLQLDEEGNVQNAPERYRRFFMKETQRSLGL